MWLKRKKIELLLLASLIEMKKRSSFWVLVLMVLVMLAFSVNFVMLVKLVASFASARGKTALQPELWEDPGSLSCRPFCKCQSIYTVVATHVSRVGLLAA